MNYALYSFIINNNNNNTKIGENNTFHDEKIMTVDLSEYTLLLIFYNYIHVVCIVLSKCLIIH